MPRPRSLLTAFVLAVAAVVPAPAAAGAATPLRPLADVPPTSAGVPDRVLRDEPRAMASAREAVYRSAQGTPIRVSVSAGYAAGLAAVQSYVDFLEALPHGPELPELRLRIATPEDVVRECGGVDGVLACYSARRERMIVPGDPVVDGVPASYIITHEYGHHVAANRDNAPFAAIAFGPKHWASEERVCALTAAGRVFPGDEGRQYARNPGEAWAEAYARLRYPELRWRFAPVLRPDAAALEAARRDVLEPWTGPVRRTFAGRFTPAGADVRRHRLALTLDGTLRIQLDGPRAADYDLRVVADGEAQGRTSRAGTSDRLRFAAACREQSRETVTVEVLRRRGSGPYALDVRYAG